MLNIYTAAALAETTSGLRSYLKACKQLRPFNLYPMPEELCPSPILLPIKPNGIVKQRSRLDRDLFATRLAFFLKKAATTYIPR